MSSDDRIKQLNDSLSTAYQTIDPAHGGQPWSPILVGCLSGALLLFCLLVLAIAAYIVRGRQVEPAIMMKWFGLTLILCLSAFLMIVGYGQEQLTPIVGLFGAIAGYLLGKDTKQPDAAPRERPTSNVEL